MISNQQGPEGHRAQRSHVTLQAVRPGSFPLFLVTSLLVYGVNGSAIASPAVLILARIVVACAGLYVLSASRITFWLGVIVLAILITFEARLWPLDPRISRGLQDAITIGFILWLLFVVLRAVFRPGTATRNAVVGALCGFLIILFAFTRAHGLIEALYPQSYRADGLPLSERSDAMVLASFQYFSTTTLTTLGCDIVPITPTARIATGLETIVGQLYLAVVIATLVARHASARRE